VLVQAWLDKGDAKMAVAGIFAPFTVAPPIAHIEPGKGHAFRVFIRMNHSRRVRNKESVFWLSALEISPQGAAQLNKFQLRSAFLSNFLSVRQPSKYGVGCACQD
jgi:P pilus assembly chaperone PapD